MKHSIIKKISVITLITLFFSCNSTKTTNQTKPDIYDHQKENSTLQAQKEIDYANVDRESIVKLNEKKSFFEDFFSLGNKDDFVQYDTSTVFTKNAGGIKEKKITMVINTDNYSAGFGCNYMTNYYILTFDEDARNILKKSAEQYFSDFENKLLNRKNNKTYQAYGKIPYHLDWGTVASSTPNFGDGKGYCGYEFVNNSPYFTISNFPFPNGYFEEVLGNATRESLALKFYFTKAQLKQLIELLDNNIIYNKLVEQGIIYIPTQADEY